MKKLSTVLLAITMVLCINTYAQIGANDPTFNATDVGFGRGDAANANVFTSALQPDGKIVIGGVFTEYEGKKSNYLARLNADGSLDPSFNTGTGADISVFATAIQSDGKIIIGGIFTTYNGVARNCLARLNSDGSLDATFNIGTGPDDGVHAIAIQSDGKIIIGGDFTMYNGVSRNGIARVNLNGSLDVTFNVGTGTDSNVTALALQTDGKIIVAGDFGSYNNVSRYHLARLNSNGSLDATFNSGTGTDSSIFAVAIQSDGKIVISGYFSTYNSTTRNGIARLNADSSLDGTFNPGTGLDDYISDIAIQSDGKIIIGGPFTTYNGVSRNGIGRINSDGTLDATFNVGTGVDEDVESMLIQSDGKIIIGGLFVNYNGISRNNIARLNTNGSLDVTFNNVGTGVNGFIQTISKQSDGKMIIGGYFTAYNGIVTKNLARINADGSMDVTFNTGTLTRGNVPVYATAIQSDGKIIVGGDFYFPNDTYGKKDKSIARLNMDGSVDATFNGGYGADSILRIAIQSDERIIISGNFTQYNGVSMYHLARLNTDGSVDATFDVGIGIGANEPVLATAIQNDGKIIIGGHFTTYSGTTVNHLARLNTNGSIDGTFNVGLGANDDVRTIGIQSDGKIIIGGNFTMYNGTGKNRIVRLNTNGSLDATFNVGTGADSPILTSVIQGDGKIVIGGNFTSYNGTARKGIARLNTDGSLDATFDVGTGANSVLATIIQSDGKIVIGGDFISYNGTGRNRMARILVQPCTTFPDVTTSVSGALITANQSGATYQWLDCNNSNALIQGEKNKTYTVTKNGNYAVAVTLNSCSKTSDCVDVIVTGIEKPLPSNNQFTVYPNPSNGAFTIQSTSEGFYSILNDIGQPVQTFELNDFNNRTMNIENLSQGIYFITAFNRNKIASQKIVVTK